MFSKSKNTWSKFCCGLTPMQFQQYQGVTVAAPLHRVVNTVDSEIHTLSAGSAQAKTRKSWRLGFPRDSGKKIVQCLPELVLPVSYQRQQLCTPFSCVLYPLQLRFVHPSAAAAIEGVTISSLLLQRCSCVGHMYLHGHAAIKSWKKDHKSDSDKACSSPAPLCLMSTGSYKLGFLLLLWALAAWQQ